MQIELISYCNPVLSRMSWFSDYTPGGQNMQHMILIKGSNESSTVPWRSILATWWHQRPETRSTTNVSKRRSTYREVGNSSLSLLIAHFQIFRGLIKGKFDAYVLWPLAKKFQNWIIDRSTARDFTVWLKSVRTQIFNILDFYTENHSKVNWYCNCTRRSHMSLLLLRLLQSK
jgi:hypothetical protein